MSNSPIDIQETDLKGPCYRLNRALKTIWDQITSNFTELSTKIDSIINPDIAWHSLTLQNSWVSGGVSIFGIPAYAVYNNRLYLRGRITGGTIVDNTVLFQLPLQATPPLFKYAIILANDIGFTFYKTTNIFIINTTGNVVILGAPAATAVLTLDSSFPLF